MDKYYKLTANFKWYEFWSNNFGMEKIEPPQEFFPDVLHVAQQLQIVRNELNISYRKPYAPEITITVTSAYRTPEWNSSKSVEGASGSLHLKAKVADSKAANVPVKVYFAYICRYTDLNHLGLYITMGFVHAGILDKLTIFKS